MHYYVHLAVSIIIYLVLSSCLLFLEFDKSLFEIPSQGQHYSQQWLMEELNEEGGETARLNSWQTKDLQDETSERMCMYCRKNINFVLFFRCFV